MRFVEIAQLVVISCVATLGCLLAGCSAESEPDELSTMPSDVDGRFASADALLVHYNSIATRTPVDIRAAFELFYAENDKQRQFLDIMRNTIPAGELDQLMRERFGEGLDPRSKTAMLQGDGPATITTRADRRAEAKFTDKDGKPQTLHLVQIGDRWWVSGYTIEYVPEWKEMNADMDKFAKFLAAAGDAAKSTIAKIKDGSVTTAQDARKALAEALTTSIPEVPPPRGSR